MVYKNGFAAAIKCNGSILREDGENVYLPFGSEYSIILKNKDSRRVLVDVEVDGKNVLNDHKLILGANETQEIKGFMKDMSVTNSFKFIEKTKEISAYRGDRIDDGLVRISYQFERPPVLIRPRPRAREIYYGADINNINHYTGDSSDYFLNYNSITTCCTDGITVKGQEINQNYTYGNIGTLVDNIDIIIFNLRGLKNKTTINKPISTKTKITCETCGRKNKSFNKFCYNCGTYLK